MKPLVFFSYLLTPLVRLIKMTKITGKNNYPDTDSPIIVCANHISNWDPVIISTTLQKPFRYVAKKSLFNAPVVGPIVKWFECIPVDRDSRDVSSLRTAIRASGQGQPVVIFPQGKRIKGQKPCSDQAKKGVALMIASTRATVVPVGLYCKGYKSGIFRRYYINIGKPVSYEMYKDILENGDKDTRFERLTEFVFDKVCCLASDKAEQK